jgi:hypothetical protein
VDPDPGGPETCGSGGSGFGSGSATLLFTIALTLILKFIRILLQAKYRRFYLTAINEKPAKLKRKESLLLN